MDRLLSILFIAPIDYRYYDKMYNNDDKYIITI